MICPILGRRTPFPRLKGGVYMEKLDYKKVYKDLYLPKAKPMQIEVPSMNFIMVRGKGNPNQECGEYQQAMQLLYGLSFTIKMSKMGKQKINGYFEYVVPPLEGFWWQKGRKEIDYTHKENFEWISMIRQPEFVTKEVFDWACEEVRRKKGLDTAKAEFQEYTEGLCIQMMHFGSYDEEPETLAQLEEYRIKENLKNDIGARLENGMVRNHHEIYLSDPRKTAVENLRTVIRIPVVKEN